MNIKIYNTLSGKKEIIKPLKGKKINLFVCGPTVYDFPHLGHARTYISFDSFAKFLRTQGFNVFYLQNITDLDDKIIARAKEKGVSPKTLAVAFEKEYLLAMKQLKIDSVKKYARATNYIKEIISQVKRLLENGYAYQIDDGVYYDISKFKNYGKLSGRTSLQAEDAVSRVDYNKGKRNRGDFCLWKISSPEEPCWKSPWGKGRPGWHIEDTAITEKFFGQQYDIHGGARDLIFPHHEAEISQMEAISGKSPFVKYWMHAGFLTIDGQKMSKSLGNFITVTDFLKRHSYQQLRFLIIKNLWRSPIDYSDSAMFEVRAALEKMEEFLIKIKNQKSKTKNPIKISKLIKKLKTDFYNELANDFNTPKAFAALFDFINKTNKAIDDKGISPKEAKGIYNFFEEINVIFGIIDFKKVNLKIPLSIEKLLKQREKFRKERNFEKADETRQKIEKQGFMIEDTKNGPVAKKL